MPEPTKPMTCSIGTLHFRIYNVSNDGRFVNVEVVSDDGEVGNIDCSMKEWQALSNADATSTEKLRAENERLRDAIGMWRNWSDEVAPPWGRLESRDDNAQRELISKRMAALLRSEQSLTELAHAVAAERDSALRELERWRHGQQIEGDYVCPDSLALATVTAERDVLLQESRELREMVERREVAGGV